MSICQRYIVDKHCFIYCGPERCNCKNGNRLEWEMQEAKMKKILDNLKPIVIEHNDKDSY